MWYGEGNRGTAKSSMWQKPDASLGFCLRSLFSPRDPARPGGRQAQEKG